MNASLPLPLGPFDLHEVIGHGGMAEVWRGQHRESGVPVAVKVLTGALGSSAFFERAFEREVQIVAGLDHPNIVMVLDYGVLGQQTAEHAQDQLKAGSPYLVMELAQGGTLRHAMDQGLGSWHETRSILLSLLDALSHAHARDIIHLDIKPANVLWFNQNQQPGWKLTDFGVSHATDHARTASVSMAMGTPAYMAPEQIEGQWRDYGPWTDLYGLGVMAYEMVAGHVPFQGDNSVQTLDRHLSAQLPRLTSRFPVPVALEPWLRALLSKSPQDRYQRAADAAWALLMMGEPVVQGPTHPWGQRRATHTLRLEDADTQKAPKHQEPTVKLPSQTTAALARQSHSVETTAPTSEPTPTKRQTHPLPPLPQSWRRMHRPPRPLRLQGAGLGLFGLRAVPMVGRISQRDALWNALRDAATQRSVRLMVLRGGRGTGKSRLAQWFCHRTHEVGAAQTFQARFDPEGAGGLAEMLVRHMGCARLSRSSLIERVQSWLQDHGSMEAWDMMALVELMSEQTDRRIDARWYDPKERSGPIYRILEREAQRRPAVVWLDDAHWSHEALELARCAMEQGLTRPCPMVIIMTVQDDALEDMPEVAQRLAALLDDPRATQMGVGTLSNKSLMELVQDARGLEAKLAQQVVERCDGNPLFAVQFIDDWVARGLMRPGPQGFYLEQGAPLDLPISLHRVWRTRVTRLLEGRTRHDRVALELAAALGLRVREPEWRAACMQSMIRPSKDLVAEMVGRRLAVWDERGWAFVHGMLRESLLQSARQAGRLPAYHRACAEMLIKLYGTHRPNTAGRLGHHLMEAGQYDPAADALNKDAANRTARGDFAEAHRTLDASLQALQALQAPPSDHRRGQTQMLRLRIARLQGRFDEAQSLARALDTAAATHGWDLVRVRGQLEQGNVAFQRGQLQTAMKIFSSAVELSQWLDDPSITAEGMLGMGGVSYRQGQRRQAWTHMHEALEHFEEARDDEGIARALKGLAQLAMMDGRWKRATDLYTRAMARHERLGNRRLWASCLNGVAEVKRHQGQLDEALADYRRVLTILEPMGVSDVQVVQLNMALLHVARGDMIGARLELTRLLEETTHAGQSWLHSTIHAAMLVCAADAADWEAWDEHMRHCQSPKDPNALVDVDCAQSIQQAAELAAYALKNTRAHQAYTLALELWARLGLDDRAKGLRHILETVVP